MSSQDATGARITDEDIERARAQIGVPSPVRHTRWNPVPDTNAIRHFAFANGDDNPLWHDLDYGLASRWRGQIAPPMFLLSTGVNPTPPVITPESKALFRGLFRGVGKYFSAAAWEWYRPVYPGEPVFEDGRTTVRVLERSSAFSGSRVVVETYRTIYTTRTGDVIAVQYEDFTSAERSGSSEAGKYANTQRQHYTPEDIERIDADYDAEVRRGSELRLWEDVQVGDFLQPVVKGPLTVVDIVSTHFGIGWGPYGFGPLRYASKHRKRMPAFFVPDEYGVPDVVQRVHWDSQWASALGLPAPYDYGEMRVTWLTHLLTNWMGDDAWLWKLGCQVRGFNFLGDTHWCTGEITRKYKIDDSHLVDIEVRATNQRGEVTTPGTATVILPSASGAITLPRPDFDESASQYSTESSLQ